jgi:hypothetical protein
MERVNVGGTLAVAGGTGDVFIASGADLAVGGITAQGTVSIASLGGITGTADEGQADITAPAVWLVSLGSHDVGGQNDPIRLSADSFSGFGRNIYITNDRAITFGNVTGENEVVIRAAGAVSTSGGTLAAQRLEIAADGDVTVDTNAGSLLVAGKNITIINHSPHLNVLGISGEVIAITADGSVGADPHGESIEGQSLMITAGGDIGTKEQPLRIFISGKVETTSLYGEVHLLRVQDENANYSYRVLKDEKTGVTVAGHSIHWAATLRVNDIDLDGDFAILDLIRAAIKAHKLLAGYEIVLDAGGAQAYRGKLTITIPVDEAYNGQTVYVIYEDKNGATVSVECVVENGAVTFVAEGEISPVAVVLPLVGIPQTGGEDVPIAFLLFAAGLLMLAATRRRRKG